MANQANYPQELTTLINQRPTRLNAVDHQFVTTGKKTVLFGTDEREYVEIWLYNPDGTFASHVNIPISSDWLGLTTVLDNTGTWEFLNTNLQLMANEIGVDPGRYSMVANFFRDEVGSEAGYKLYLQEISDDRSEIKVSAIVPDEQIVADIKEFVTPAVPRLEAQAIIDQTFGKALEGTGEQDQVLFIEDLKRSIQTIVADIQARLNVSQSDPALEQMFNIMIERIYKRVLDVLAADSKNRLVQREELINYLDTATVFTLQEMKQNYEIDPRFELI